MLEPVLAALFVLMTWWLSTGVILLMDGLPRSTFRFSLGGTSALATAGLYGLWWSSRFATRPAAYLGFGCALAVWAWHELTFLLGIVTGPRKAPCPDDASGARRFLYATAAVIHHELALALTMLAICVLTLHNPNQVGTWTFLVLWTMRLSAKLNLFFGVRNLNTEFIPQHLRYLLSYFKKSRLNPLMPFSLLIAGGVVAYLTTTALSTETTPFVLTSHILVATMLALAVLEHIFLILPLPDALLWRWAVRAGHGAGPEG